MTRFTWLVVVTALWLCIVAGAAYVVGETVAGVLVQVGDAVGRLGQ